LTRLPVFWFSHAAKNERATQKTRAPRTNDLLLVIIDFMATVRPGLSSKYFNEKDFYRACPIFAVEHRKNRWIGSEERDREKYRYKHGYAPNKKAYSG